MPAGDYDRSLVDAVARFICNFKHGGIDVWSMLDGNEQTKGHWRSEALFYVRGMHSDLAQKRPPLFIPCNIETNNNPPGNPNASR